MAMVEPGVSSSMAADLSPLLFRQSMMPWTRWAGVVRLLACTKAPAASSKPMRSVNVPPISMATTSTQNPPRRPVFCVPSFDRAARQRGFGHLDLSLLATSRSIRQGGYVIAAICADRHRICGPERKIHADPSRRRAISVFTDRHLEPSTPWAKRMGRKSAPRRPPARRSVRLAADIGGTFTDIAVFDDRSGKLVFGKALSTPARLVDGISHGVAKAGSDYGSAGPVPPRSAGALDT